MILFFAALLGLCVGAVVNAFVLRTESALAFTVGRACAVCAMPTHMTDMVPIVGYVAMKGKCRKCQAVVPQYYLLVELVMGLAFFFLGARIVYGWGISPDTMTHLSSLALLFVRDAMLVTALVLVSAFDVFARVIPDRVTLPAIVGVFALQVALGGSPVMIAFGGLLIGGFFAVQVLLSRGKWAGGGDVRMGILMGVALGPLVGVLGLFLSYLLGAFVGLQLLLWRRASLKTRVPFGIFLALSTFICLFFGDAFVGWYMRLLS